MKILLTGATGFIGPEVARKLLAKGHAVGAVVRKASAKKNLDERVRIFVFDGEDIDGLAAFLKTEQFDGVIHLASLYLAAHTSGDIRALVDSNILFSVQLAEACAAAGVPWFINAGSFAQHYQSKKYSPANLYAATKQAFEDIIAFYRETSKTVFVTIKLFDTFGPGDRRPKIFSLWSKIAKTGEVLDMSPGRQVIDMNYVEDVADGFVKMAELLSSNRGKKYNGEVFTLSSGRRYTLRQLAKIFERASGVTLNINWGKRPYRIREIMRPWRGKNVPGWKPKVPLERAIKLTLDAER